MGHLRQPGTGIAHLGFLALFPGFFFYHSALGMGLVGPFLGGFFSRVCMLFLPLLVITCLSRAKRDRRFFTRADLAFFIFLAYFFFVIAFNYANGGDGGLAQDHLFIIIQFATVYLIFRLADFASGRFRMCLIASMLVMALLIFYLSADGTSYLREENSVDAGGAISTYQGFARSYFVTCLVLLAFTKATALRLLIYLVSVPALFINGARSELVALIAVIGLAETVYASRKSAALLVALFLGGAVLGAYIDQLIRALPDSRVLELLDLSQSTSWSGRKYYFEHALKTIGENPILGDYGSYLSIGGRGAYAHNIFSAWVDLGLAGFVYLLCMLLVPAYKLAVRAFFRRSSENTGELVLTFCLLFATLLLLFTSKTYGEMLIAASVGRYAHYRYTSGRRHIAPRAAGIEKLNAMTGARRLHIEI